MAWELLFWAQALENLQHRNEPSAVRQTRARAGLIDEGGTTSNTAYPLDIVVNAENQVFVRGRGLDAELGGRIRLRGTSSDVQPDGRLELIRGRLDILGKRLDLTEASAQLLGGFDPFIRAVGSTQAEDTDVMVTVEGFASAPEITVSSSPDLPQDEILALLLFGRSVAEISPLQALRIAAAVRTLSGRGGEGLTGAARTTIGLDDLDVTTNAEGEVEVSGGKYLNENTYSDVSVDATGRSQINLNLKLTPSVTTRGSVGSDGTSSLGIFFERDY